MKDVPKHPFEDIKIHQTVDTQQVHLEDRPPFNDVIKHGDILNGSQSPKRIDQVPKSIQNPLRIFTIITILILLSTSIYQIIQFFMAAASDK